MNNQDKKEMLEMIAECSTKGGYVSLEKELLKKAASLPQDEPERKMPEGEYAECKDCANKPGSPTLCDVCLHNRALVGRLQEENRKLNNIVTKLSEPL